MIKKLIKVHLNMGEKPCFNPQLHRQVSNPVLPPFHWYRKLRAHYGSPGQSHGSSALSTFDRYDTQLQKKQNKPHSHKSSVVCQVVAGFPVLLGLAYLRQSRPTKHRNSKLEPLTKTNAVSLRQVDAACTNAHSLPYSFKQNTFTRNDSKPLQVRMKRVIFQARRVVVENPSNS